MLKVTCFDNYLTCLPTYVLPRSFSQRPRCCTVLDMLNEFNMYVYRATGHQLRPFHWAQMILPISFPIEGAMDPDGG